MTKRKRISNDRMMHRIRTLNDANGTGKALASSGTASTPMKSQAKHYDNRRVRYDET
jgi:hypothetical protein